MAIDVSRLGVQELSDEMEALTRSYGWAHLKELIESKIEQTRAALESAQPERVPSLQGMVQAYRNVLLMPQEVMEQARRREE